MIAHVLIYLASYISSLKPQGLTNRGRIGGGVTKFLKVKREQVGGPNIQENFPKLHKI